MLNFLRRHEIRHSASEIEYVFSRFDKNKDSKIDFDEVNKINFL